MLTSVFGWWFYCLPGRGEIFITGLLFIMRHIAQVMGYIGYPAKALGGINNGLGLVFDNSGGIFALDHGFFYGFIDGRHELLDVFYGFTGAGGKLADFLCYYAKAGSRCTGTGRFNGGIQAQKPGLLGDTLDKLGKAVDFACDFLYIANFLAELPLVFINVAGGGVQGLHSPHGLTDAFVYVLGHAPQLLEAVALVSHVRELLGKKVEGIYCFFAAFPWKCGLPFWRLSGNHQD